MKGYYASVAMLKIVTCALLTSTVLTQTTLRPPRPGVKTPGVKIAIERLKPEAIKSPAHEALWRAKIDTCIPALEAEADALAAAPFNIGHIAIGVALAYLNFRFSDEAWAGGHPKLAAWHAAFNARPSVVATHFAEG